jgi:hypothetical protein
MLASGRYRGRYRTERGSAGCESHLQISGRPHTALILKLNVASGATALGSVMHSVATAHGSVNPEVLGLVLGFPKLDVAKIFLLKDMAGFPSPSV